MPFTPDKRDNFVPDQPLGFVPDQPKQDVLSPALKALQSTFGTAGKIAVGRPETLFEVEQKARDLKTKVGEVVTPKERIFPGEPIKTAVFNVPRVAAETLVETTPMTPLEIGTAFAVGKVGKAGIKGVGKLISKTKVGKKVVNTLTKDIPLPFKPATKHVAAEATAKQILPRDPLAKERGLIKTIKGSPMTDPVVAKRVEGQYIPRSTDVLAQQARETISSNPAKAMDIAMNQTDDKAIATAMELVKDLQNKGDFESAVNIVNNLAPKLTELGRSIQAVSIYNRLTPTGIVRFASKKLKDAGLKLKADDAKKLFDAAIRVEKMPNSLNKTIEMSQLMGKVDDLVPSPASRKLVNLWKAGLLTGLKTSGVNTASNATHLLAEQVSRIPAVAVDSVAKLFTGKRSVGLPSPVQTVKGFGEGLKKGWRFFRTGFDERNMLGKYDYRKVNYGKGPVAKALRGYEQTVFRAMGAEDQPFYYAQKAASIFEQARIAAKNAGLSGSKAKRFIDEMVTNPTDDIVKNAVLDAQSAVFQNRTILGEIGSAVQTKSPVAEVIVPFTKTPAAVFMQAVNYSPIGAIKTIVRNIGRGKFNQRDLAIGLGRSATGAGILATGAALYKKGMMTLEIPKSEKERRQWELEGKQPNSVKVDGRWRRMESIGPIGLTLLVGGHFRRAYDDSGSKVMALTNAIGSLGRSAIDQTFLTGASTLLQTLQDPERSGTLFIRNMARSTVPTIVADIATARDPLQRQTVDKEDLPLTIKQTVQARIPGQREKLPERVDVLGQVRERPGGPLATMIDVFRSTPERSKDDPVVQELGRLARTDEDIATPTLLKQKVKVSGKEINIPTKQLTEIQKTIGTNIKDTFQNIMKSNIYQKVDDRGKSSILKAISRDIRQVETLRYAVKNNLITKNEFKRVFATTLSNPARIYYITKKYVPVPTQPFTRSNLLRSQQ